MTGDLLGLRPMLYLKDFSREGSLEVRRTSSASPASKKVLVLTAATGGGHEAAGRAVRAELEQAGYSVVMADGLRTMSRTLDWLLVRGYEEQVRHTPGSMGAVFAVTSRKGVAAVIRGIVALLFAGRLHKLLRREHPDLVVSTYPLVTAALGRLQGCGKLQAPVVAIIADYGVHPLWVTPEADLHLVASRLSAGLARRAGGRASVARLPVAPAFYAAPAREEARAALRIPQQAFVVLIVGGALGVGDLEGAARCAVGSGAYTVVVTGNNRRLEARLRTRFGARKDVWVLGWTEEMPALMAAADCLVQNAGGMTCIEAVEMGLPILLYNSVPGHGDLNVRIMELAGSARQVHTAEELGEILKCAVRRETSLSVPNKEDAPTVSTILGSLGRRRFSAPRTPPAPRVAAQGSGRRGSALSLAGSLLSRDGVLRGESALIHQGLEETLKTTAQKARMRVAYPGSDRIFLVLLVGILLLLVRVLSPRLRRAIQGVFSSVWVRSRRNTVY